MDCNNFYVSCERVFDPKLIHKAVVVLSNNDGCIISRSNEAKALGIAMGAPYFKIKQLCKNHQVEVLSSNYTLYGNISKRIMDILSCFTPDLEAYSIDEAFLRLDKMAGIDPISLCQAIVVKIKQYTGIPVSIGIGPTKTLAKVANYYGKKNGLAIYDLRASKDQESALTTLDVGDIWGIGKRMAIRLNEIGIFKAKELREADYKMIRKAFGVIGEKIVHELNGISCLELETIFKAKKNIMISRSFGGPVTEIEELEEALSTYAARACVKMRAQNSKLQGIVVFLITNWHNKDQPFYKNSSSLHFDLATDNTIQIARYAKQCLQRIYKPGYRYKKVGIILLDLVSNSYEQASLLTDSASQTKNSHIMKVVDSINKKMGKNSLFLASQGIKREWQMKSAKRSWNFTSDWNQLMLVN